MKKSFVVSLFYGLQYLNSLSSLLQPYALKSKDTGIKLSEGLKLMSIDYLKFNTKSLEDFASNPKLFSLFVLF